MCHKLTLAQDIAARLHDGLVPEDWFFTYTDDLVTAAVHDLKPGQLKSTVTVAKAILDARPFAQYDEPGTTDYRLLFNDLCDVIDPLLNDYARFLGRQLELEPVVSRRTNVRRPKALPPTPEQRKALDDYVKWVIWRKAVEGRQFPPNVIDLVQYRALRA